LAVFTNWVLHYDRKEEEKTTIIEPYYKLLKWKREKDYKTCFLADRKAGEVKENVESCIMHRASYYHKDRLKNLVSLSPSLYTNGLSYLGKETWPTLCINNAKLRSGMNNLEQNKHQLLHRIASVKTPLIYNTIAI